MKKVCYAIACIALITACNQPDNKTTDAPAQSDTSVVAPPPSLPQDSLLKMTSRKILQLMKAGDYASVGAFVHPKGVLFSPYGYIDTATAMTLTEADLRADSSQKKLTWGTYDGSGDPIQLTREAYFRKFVYGADYLQAEKTSYNTIIGKGNSLNNLSQVFPGSVFTEHHFSGFEKKYQGMDWKSLRLVYIIDNGQPLLIAIVNDQWTT